MEPFQAVGLALVVAAIVGGGLEAAGVKIGVVESLPRQIMLGCLGVVVFAAGTPAVWSWTRPEPPSGPALSSLATPPVLLLSATPLSSPTAALPVVTAVAPSETPVSGTSTALVPSATPTVAPSPTEAAAPAATSAAAPDRLATIVPAIRKDAPARRP